MGAEIINFIRGFSHIMEIDTGEREGELGAGIEIYF